MISGYIAYMTKLGVDMQKQTQSVSFTSPEMLRWMNEVFKYTDEFRICLGVYPDTHPQAGWITTIIWPYKEGKPATEPETPGKDGGTVPIKPYNEGQHNP